MSFDFFNNIRDWFGTEARDAKVMARVNATNVCEHLRPIEQLMRASRIDLRIATEHRITVNCLINFEKLSHQLNLAESVTYIEPHIPDRSMLDPHSAIIVCSGCNSSIFAVHKDSATQNTPWFPR